MSIDFDEGMRMARWMKESADEVTEAIKACQTAQWGVVALRFSDSGRDMEVVTLDLPYEPDVRIYPG